MKISQIITEARSGVLYHAIPEIKNAYKQLKNDKLYATVEHRFSPTGKPTITPNLVRYGLEDYTQDTIKGLKRFKTHDEFEDLPENEKQLIDDYINSIPMVGISTSRDKSFAFNWGEVVLELDANLISQQYQIKPIDYFAVDRTGRPTGRSESEEFIVISKTNRSYDQLSYLPKLMKYIIGIYVDERFQTRERSRDGSPNFGAIIANNYSYKFKGFI